jgi:2'-5' RNA ligase
MALLCLKLPHEPARLLSEVKVPGERTAVDQLHVTLLYLGKEIELEAILLATQVTYQVVSTWSPFLMTTRWVSTFRPTDEGTVPVIAHVESDDLHELQEALKDAFDEEGVPYSKKWPVYKPHITLSYASIEDTPDDFTIHPVQWSCTDVVLWGGDEGENDIVTRFLSLLRPEPPPRRLSLALRQTTSSVLT